MFNEGFWEVEMEITERNNFMRIFRIPHEFPSDFCFGGGHPVEFQLVDWFQPVPSEMVEDFDAEKHRGFIRDFIETKAYIKSNYQYLALADYGDVFLI